MEILVVACFDRRNMDFSRHNREIFPGSQKQANSSRWPSVALGSQQLREPTRKFRSLMQVGHDGLFYEQSPYHFDDHPIIIAASRWLLEQDSATTVFDVNDVLTGYQAFRQHEPDIIIVDLRLQREDLGGLALIKRVRS